MINLLLFLITIFILATEHFILVVYILRIINKLYRKNYIDYFNKRENSTVFIKRKTLSIILWTPIIFFTVHIFG